jgi:hypothetical protein
MGDANPIAYRDPTTNDEDKNLQLKNQNNTEDIQYILELILLKVKEYIQTS